MPDTTRKARKVFAARQAFAKRQAWRSLFGSGPVFVRLKSWNDTTMACGTAVAVEIGETGELVLRMDRPSSSVIDPACVCR